MKIVCVVVAVLGLLSGCCGSTPDVRKYFHREDPLTALLGFAYAVEVGEWVYAFESLDAESKRVIENPTRLRFGVWIETEPTTGRGIGELIVESIRHRGPPQIVSREVRSIDVAYSADPDEFDPEIAICVFLVLEDDGWKVDLARTIPFNFPEHAFD